MRRPLLGLWVCLFLVACSHPSIQHYRDRKPEFRPEHFFQGDLYARGLVKNRSGEVIRTFDADLSGQWQQDSGVLEETFRFDDGEIQHRTWRFHRETDGSLVARAGDVVGAARMRLAGNAAHMRYQLQIPYRDQVLEVQMDDWMYLITPDTLINETRMSKFGIDVGEVVLVIGRKQPASR